MITALQSARIKAVNNMVEAREKLIACRSLVCFDGPAVANQIDRLSSEIDEIIKELVPNETI